MSLSIYKLCAATTFVGLSDDNGLDCIETEIILAQYRMIYTDYLEFAINPAQRLMMHGSSPFVACSHTVEVGYVLNKLNTLHQCGCDIPIHKLSYYKRTYFVKREVRKYLPNNTIFLESVSDSVATRRDPYTDCAPTLWSCMNFVT